MLAIGSTPPYFVCKDQNGLERKLTDYLDTKLVMFFYPKANTPGCTNEAKNFQANINKLKSLGFKILGISADTMQSNKKFADNYALSFPLLCDTTRELIRAYEADNNGKIKRITYVVENGKISHALGKIDTQNATEQLLTLLSNSSNPS